MVRSKMTLFNRMLAEALGTFAMVFVGTGAIVIDQQFNGVITHAGIALTFGLIVLAMIYTLGDVSGAHFNPAVTVAFFAARRLESNVVIPYVLSQTVGALCASGLLWWMFPESNGLGATHAHGPHLRAFVMEFVLTLILMVVILSVSTGAQEKGITAGIVIGSVIGLEAMFAGPVCGASMNPVRSLAPALVSWQLGDLWIYLLAPVMGALAAVPLTRALRPTV